MVRSVDGVDNQSMVLPTAMLTQKVVDSCGD